IRYSPSCSRSPSARRPRGGPEVPRTAPSQSGEGAVRGRRNTRGGSCRVGSPTESGRRSASSRYGREDAHVFARRTAPVIESCTSETFAPHLGTTFRIAPSEGPGLDVELITVTLQERLSPAQGRRAPFLLLFRGPRTPVLPQRIYTLNHAQLGTFEL